MKRPLCVIGLTLTLATWLAFSFSGKQTLLLSIAAAATGLLLLIRKSPRLRVACMVCFAAATALGGHTLYEATHITPFAQAAGERVVAVGMVTDAHVTTKSITYTLSAQFPARDDLPAVNMSLRTFGELDFIEGDVIRTTVKLDDEVATPLDYGFSRGNFVSGMTVDLVQRMEGGYPLQRFMVRLRNRMQNNVYSHLSTASGDLITAMALGLQDNVNPDVYSSVNRAGTAHLLTVSGLHLSVLTAFVLKLLERLRMPRRPAAVAAIAAAFAFSGLVGFSASILRSFLMTAITLVARATSRKGDSLSSLGLAVTVICIFRPTWILGRGFWFSAGSTLGILLFGSKLSDHLISRLKGKDKLYNRFVKSMVGAGAISLAAYVFTLPLFVVFNGWISLVSPLANVLVAPFVAPMIGGGVLCAMTGSAGLLMQIVAAITEFCTSVVLLISQIMSSLPFATASLDESWMLAWIALLVAAGVVLLVFRGGKQLVTYAVILGALTFSVGQLSYIVTDRGRVQLVTIAQCDAAILLRDKEAVILGTPDKYEINRLLRYLEFRGVQRIAAVIATDSGEQIGTGMLRLAARYPIDCIVGPDDDYILGQIAVAFPDIPLYSSGYATMETLGGVKITSPLPTNDILIEVKNNTILKTADEYGIIEHSQSYTIGIYPRDALHLNGALGYEPTPMGRALYGETRFLLLP